MDRTTAHKTEPLTTDHGKAPGAATVARLRAAISVIEDAESTEKARMNRAYSTGYFDALEDEGVLSAETAQTYRDLASDALERVKDQLGQPGSRQGGVSDGSDKES